MRVPVELYQHVFQHVELEDLCALCLVSNFWRSQSEAILYRDVDLLRGFTSDRWARNVISWSSAVVKRDRLAKRLVSLCLPSLHQNQWELVTSPLQTALRHTSHLTQIRIMIVRPDMSIDEMMECAHGYLFKFSVLMECPFQLQTLDIDWNVSAFSDDQVEAFFRTQPGITNLRMRLNTLNSPLSESLSEILPSLSCLSVSLQLDMFSSLNFVARLPIRRLCIDVVEEGNKEDMLQLGYFLRPALQSLTQLHINTDRLGSLPCWSFVDTAHSLAENCPALTHFSFVTLLSQPCVSFKLSF